LRKPHERSYLLDGLIYFLAICGRNFFEDVIRENLDIGRPKQVQLIFDRGVTKTTPGSFRTRVITDGVIPSLHIDYKGTRVKQYHKEGQALRTETTINNTRDFYIGKSLPNLPALRQIGFQANRRLLQTQRITHDSILAEETFQKLNQPHIVDGQRASALRFADPMVQAIWNALLLFDLLPARFSNRNLRTNLAALRGQSEDRQARCCRIIPIAPARRGAGRLLVASLVVKSIRAAMRSAMLLVCCPRSVQDFARAFSSSRKIVSLCQATWD
jgi:hypothetical protein